MHRPGFETGLSPLAGQKYQGKFYGEIASMTSLGSSVFTGYFHVSFIVIIADSI